MRVLEASDRAHELVLHLEWQAGGNPVRVDFIRAEPFGLHKDLMRRLVGEADDFILDRWTVPGAHTLDDTREHWRAVRGGTDDLMGPLVCLGYEAISLQWVVTDSPQKRKDGCGLITGLRGHRRVVQRASVEAGGCPRLEPPDPEGQFAESRGEPIGWRVACASSLVVVQADVDAPSQEGAHREHDRLGFEDDTGDRDDAAHGSPVHDEVGGFLLEQGQIRLILQHRAYGLSVQLAIGLGAGCPHGRALAGIERAELDPGHVRGARHESAQCVDLSDEVTFSDASDGGVAAHLTQGLDALREQQSTRAHAGGRQRGFRAGVATANDDYVKRPGETHDVGLASGGGDPWSLSVRRRAALAEQVRSADYDCILGRSRSNGAPYLPYPPIRRDPLQSLSPAAPRTCTPHGCAGCACF